MKTDGLDDAFNVETSIVPAEIEKVQKKEKPNTIYTVKDDVTTDPRDTSAISYDAVSSSITATIAIGAPTTGEVTAAIPAIVKTNIRLFPER